MDNPTAIHVANASYTYDGKNPAFDDLSFTVEHGDFFALLGRNGAGKSSLVNCLMGFFRPSTGAVDVLGRNVWTHRRDLMNDVALVPEVPNVPPTMSPRSAARFCDRLGQRGRFDHALFGEHLEHANVNPSKAFRTLSRGQKNQVTLALALAARPRLLILDDPTLGLDAVARKRTYQALIEHQTEHEVTLFMTTHDLSALDGLATHVGFLDHGRLIECDSVVALKERYRIGAVGGETNDFPGDVVRQHTTSIGRRVLIDLSGSTRATNSGSAILSDDDSEWTAPTIEELFVALLEGSDSNSQAA